MFRGARPAVVVLALALSACVTSPVPPVYTGPTATVSDSARNETNARVQVYYVAEVNGKPIENTVSRTRRDNAGRGVMPWFSATTVSRQIPAGKTLLKLEGRIMYGAPIQEIAMAMTMYTVDLEIVVDLQPGETYTVLGELASEEKRGIMLLNSKNQRVGAIWSR